ncbi:hypothetical protein SAMN05444920_117121 [Nonomuraea solani]|uniref:Uncharacterized protein n=1 Tax=Nonomuraea solani TaxID=1144553 RepID=A0A1H6ES60_9ACTN|nr:hypothetical protein SAMN05444920_117121 [Nonomuraea solani]
MEGNCVAYGIDTGMVGWIHDDDGWEPDGDRSEPAITTEAMEPVAAR